MWILSGSRQRHPTTTSTLWWHCRCRSATAYSSDNKCPLSSQLTSLHIWRSFPYPPPGEAVGSWQLSPTALQKRALCKYTYLYLFTFTMRYDSAIFLRSSTGIGSQHGLPYAPEVTRTELERAKDRVWSYDASAAAFSDVCCKYLPFWRCCEKQNTLLKGAVNEQTNEDVSVSCWNIFTKKLPLSLSCARPAADGWPLMWVNRPL